MSTYRLRGRTNKAKDNYPLSVDKSVDRKIHGFLAVQIKITSYTRYYLFSPLYRQCHFAISDEPGQPDVII